MQTVEHPMVSNLFYYSNKIRRTSGNRFCCSFEVENVRFIVLLIL
jgi:hypothetical protein